LLALGLLMTREDDLNTSFAQSRVLGRWHLLKKLASGLTDDLSRLAWHPTFQHQLRYPAGVKLAAAGSKLVQDSTAGPISKG